MNTDKRRDKAAAKERVRRRINADFDRSKYKYIPEEKPIDFYDNDVEQRVGIYVRVSTDDIRQTTSYELQKKYYEDFVQKHPHWKLVKIYADEGISGTSTKHRDAFNQMVSDAKAHKLDLIITKSVSRFARNVEDFLGTIRSLTEQKPPVGVFFESEAIFSLNDDSQMALSFQSVMAEEESHTRSRSMESSLRMRLDNGLPLTRGLLGYYQNADGDLVINPDEKNTVKLAFFMYLYGYSTQQIADAFIALERPPTRAIPPCGHPILLCRFSATKGTVEMYLPERLILSALKATRKQRILMQDRTVGTTTTMRESFQEMIILPFSICLTI